jgi:carbamoyltransferase
MAVILGIAGASRNAALALCVGGRVVGVCEHERVTRTRRAALRHGRLPKETLATMLRLGVCSEQEIAVYAASETSIQLPPDRRVEYVDHHVAHAATAFYSSPFTDATIVVCDRRGSPELTVWRGDERGIRQEDFSWAGLAFASVYSQAAEAMGFGRDGDEHRLEALARVGERRCNADIPTIAYCGARLEVPGHFQASIAGVIGRNGSSASTAQRASLAEQIQRQIGDLLLHVVSEIRHRFGGARLCLGGGLFYNSYFTTLLAQSGLYVDTFVPANPGNAGVALGAALAVASGDAPLERQEPLSAFLGPEFSLPEIKAILDNCKLSYDYLRNGQVIERTTAALAKGQLVGWFQGRMEWGARALGNRSILASPVAPYVLENLNVFLKQREPHQTYSVAICAEDLPRYFRGPAKSSFMEYEYEVLDRDRLRNLLPANATRLRVQTVDETAGTFYELIRAFGDLTGVPMLVNTSFNGFNEPIVCSPRDAIRVFYGTGLDLAVLGSLVLVK